MAQRPGQAFPCSLFPGVFLLGGNRSVPQPALGFLRVYHLLCGLAGQLGWVLITGELQDGCVRMLLRGGHEGVAVAPGTLPSCLGALTRCPPGLVWSLSCHGKSCVPTSGCAVSLGVSAQLHLWGEGDGRAPWPCFLSVSTPQMASSAVSSAFQEFPPLLCLWRGALEVFLPVLRQPCQKPAGEEEGCHLEVVVMLPVVACGHLFPNILFAPLQRQEF